MIVLPFPSSVLAGHANSNGQWAKIAATKKHREWAKDATQSALGLNPVVPSGDVMVMVIFYPPDNRGDRINYPNRMKPYFDGIADALKINDKRFVPVFKFMEPEKPGRVEVEIGV